MGKHDEISSNLGVPMGTPFLHKPRLTAGQQTHSSGCLCHLDTNQTREDIDLQNLDMMITQRMKWGSGADSNLWPLLVKCGETIELLYTFIYIYIYIYTCIYIYMYSYHIYIYMYLELLYTFDGWIWGIRNVWTNQAVGDWIRESLSRCCWL